MELQRGLSQFDLTNIIVGAIVGADIYIASALTAGLVGPFSIILWAVAGLFAATIAMVFAYCSYYVPRVGGPFAYVSEAFDDFYGFLTGWSMWIAELLALPVFAIAFTNYLQALIPLTPAAEVAVRALFIASLTLVNIVGVRAQGGERCSHSSNSPPAPPHRGRTWLLHRPAGDVRRKLHAPAPARA